ncbi:MAG TPA: PEGA domain-containing protein, partial [Anaeromyxobacteraceae bacterium]|nr:PEGA domain-containing protein [Anaeromyxobacteraceae bacterium]
MKRIRELVVAAVVALPALAWAAGPAPAPPDAPAAAPAPPAAPPADPGAEARAAYRRGADLYRAGKYREAIAAFEEADRLKPSPALQFNIGQAREKMGEAAAALAAFARYLRLEPSAPNREAVLRSVKVLEGRLATTGLQMLHVTTDPPGADVSVDGAAAGPAPLDAPFLPGPHAVSASAPGRRSATREVLLGLDRSLEVNLVLEPATEQAAVAAAPAATGVVASPSAAAPPATGLEARPPAPPLAATVPGDAPQPAERKSWLGPIIAGSLGVVAAGAGIAFGAMARSAQNELLAGVPDR